MDASDAEMQSAPGTSVDAEPAAEIDGARPLGKAVLAAAYIPDFPLDEVQFWLSPHKGMPEAAYHELIGRSADKWGDFYYNKKGWRFVHHLSPAERRAEGPYRPAPGELRLEILESGRIFAPRPLLKVSGKTVPIVSLDKRRPLNPWKPNYIKALNFIKKHEWEKPLPAAVELAIWEVEECGEVAGSTSWRNAQMLLEDHLSEDLRRALRDLFEKRPEEYPLGSQVYLRVLGGAGEEGFRALCELHRIPQVRKRVHVARVLGKIGRPEGLEALFALADDEEPDVREAALRSLGRVGVRPDDPHADGLRRHLESPELSLRVWTAQALLKGGDEPQRKLLVNLVKENPLPLSDMGELGEVLADLGVVEAVPYLIHRLKSDSSAHRADAAEALRLLTGLPLEPVLDDEEARRQAIRAATRWWEDSKKDRRKTRET